MQVFTALIISALNRWVHHTPGIHLIPTSPTYIHVGRGGSLVDSLPFIQRVAGSNPALIEIQVIRNTYLYLKSVASPGNEERGHNMNSSSPSLPEISF